jgi:hypothetical protein
MNPIPTIDNYPADFDDTERDRIKAAELRAARVVAQKLRSVRSKTEEEILLLRDWVFPIFGAFSSLALKRAKEGTWPFHKTVAESHEFLEALAASAGMNSPDAWMAGGGVIIRAEIIGALESSEEWKRHQEKLLELMDAPAHAVVQTTGEVKPLPDGAKSVSPPNLEHANKSDPKIATIRVLCTREEIEAFATEAFSVAHDRIMEQLPEKHNQVMNQVRSTGNSGGYAHALTKLATERVRQLILVKADAYVDAFTACRAPSDEQAEKDLRRAADEFAAGSISAVSGQSVLDAGRTRRPVLPIPGIHNAMKIAVNSAVKEGLLRLKAQRIKFRSVASPFGAGTQQSVVTTSAQRLGPSTNEQTGRENSLPVPPAKRKRGRPQKILQVKKLAAADLKAAGGTNKEIAALLYDTKYPSDQQRKNVPGILRHYHQRSERLNAGPASSKGAPKPNKNKG